MRFRIENFGPIEEADITLKNLNIIIGKNSVGKSYLAYLIWALLSVEPEWIKLGNLYDEYIPDSLIEEVRSEPKRGGELASRFKSLLVELYKRFHEIWGENLEQLLKDTFFIDSLDRLIRVGSERAKVVVSNDKGDREIYVQISKDGLKTKVNKTALKDLEENLSIKIDVGEVMFITLRYKDKEYNDSFAGKLQTVGTIPASFMWLFDGYTPYASTFIAPDGRSGLIRSIEAYKYALMADPGVPVNKVDREVVRTFESIYPKIRDENISAIADFIEDKLSVKWILRREQPRYTVKIGSFEIPVQAAPSGYRELTPIIYAVKYWLREGEGVVVFIEEPEAHLHPDAQVVVTRGLARLSEYCQIVATTHSITVVDEISNLLRLAHLPPDKKRKLGYEEWERLKPKDIGIFLLSDGKVKEIRVYEDGIEESELDEIIREIANIHAKVDEEYEYSKLHAHR